MRWARWRHAGAAAARRRVCRNERGSASSLRPPDARSRGCALRTQDFIVTAPFADGDPWSAWVGAATWEALQMTLNVTKSPVHATYLQYVVLKSGSK